MDSPPTTDAVILLGNDMRIKYASPSLRQVFGHAPKEVEGRDIAMLHPERLREGHRVGILRCLQTGLKALNWHATETIGLHRDGHEFPLEIRFSRLVVTGKSIFAAFMCDITERKRAHAALENANQRLRVLSKKVLGIREEERRSILHELHDDVGQSLIALKIGLHRLEEHVSDKGLGLLSQCVEVTESVQEKLRELSAQLRPRHLEQLGLQDALLWLVNRQREMTGLAIRYRFAGVGRGRLPVKVESACYRICQEALNNATRHARATNISVELQRADASLVLAIRDDGVGFDEKSKREWALVSGSLGLISMEERARLAGGRLELSTRRRKGTCVRAIFPLAEDEGRPDTARTSSGFA